MQTTFPPAVRLALGHKDAACALSSEGRAKPGYLDTCSPVSREAHGEGEGAGAHFAG